jgi:hypothetical protein
MQLSKGEKQMQFSKLSMIAGFIIAFTLIFELTAHADEENQMTKISFSEAVQVPGTVLPAGTYQFVVARNESNQNIVQIFNADGTKLYATVQTVPAQRGKEAYGTSITLAQRPDGQPDALVTWFYPGNDIGHEFLYSKQEEKELTEDAKQTLVGDHGILVSPGTSQAGN